MTNRPSLDELARRHGTDKSSYHHRFAPVYEQHVRDLRDTPVSVLEIGVYEGASTRMWLDYFEEGRVTGIDIRPSASQYAEPRLPIYIGDQSDAEFLGEVADEEGPFDLIVDDGGHHAEQQITSLRALWPHLKPGGVYVVEDIHTSYLPRWGMGWRQQGTTVELLKTLVDDLHQLIHGQPAEISDLESIHFHFEVCILRRAS